MHTIRKPNSEKKNQDSSARSITQPSSLSQNSSPFHASHQHITSLMPTSPPYPLSFFSSDALSKYQAVARGEIPQTGGQKIALGRSGAVGRAGKRIAIVQRVHRPDSRARVTAKSLYLYVRDVWWANRSLLMVNEPDITRVRQSALDEVCELCWEALGKYVLQSLASIFVSNSTYFYRAMLGSVVYEII